VNTLVIGDHFIPADFYVSAITARLGEGFGPVRTVDWSPAKAEQHALQQVMETGGANAVPAPPEVLGAVPGAEIVCMHFAPAGREVLAAAADLRLVAVARTGLENVDIAAATARGVGVVPVYGRNASAVAELEIGLMLAEARNIARADGSIKSGGWRKDFGRVPVEIGASTVGMVGFGHVGSVLAGRLSGFGCRILVFDPYVDTAVLAGHGAERCESLERLFADADFVVIQARHTPETDRFIGKELFALMKPGAFFINTARSRLVDTDALYDVLASGRIAGAALDVYDAEPLPPGSPWRALGNVTLTTHFGGDTVTTNQTSAGLVAETIAEYAATGRVKAAVNAESLGWA